MAFSVRDFHDLVRLLETHPEWRAELRRLLLSDELLELPQLVRELAAKVDALAEAQTGAEERFSRVEATLANLADAQARSEAHLGQLEQTLSRLVEAQAETQGRVNQLEQAIARLTEAQSRAEEWMGLVEAALARLAEAQARSEERLGRMEERVGRLEEAVARLAEAQARTEERVGRLEEAVARLAEAQARTEERVGRLEEAVARLAEAQARTEERVDQLALGLERLRQEVGRLANTVGATAEEEAAAVLVEVLRKKGFELLAEPTSVAVDGREVDLAVPARTATGEVLWAVVEVKLRLSPNHVRDWAQRARSEGFRRQLREAGIPGPYLIYSYGLRILFGVHDAARAWRIGLLTPRGESVPPEPVEPAA
jgi:chromosome segregation ATPase